MPDSPQLKVYAKTVFSLRDPLKTPKISIRERPDRKYTVTIETTVMNTSFSFNPRVVIKSIIGNMSKREP